jgi:hypothetical protein
MGKYEYQLLHMGLCNSLDIFQETLSSVFEDLEFVKAYIDDIFNRKGFWSEQLQHLDLVLQILQEAGLNVNTKESFFG